MKYEAEELVQRYFDENIQAPDTNELLRKLNPVIMHKCKAVKEKNKSYVETVVFIFGCVLALLIGMSIMFPDFIDYSDELIQFVLFASAAGGLMMAINYTLKRLFINSIENENLSLRGKLL